MKVARQSTPDEPTKVEIRRTGRRRIETDEPPPQSFVLHRGMAMLVPLEEELDRELGKLARPRPSRKKDKTIVLDEGDVDLEDDVDVPAPPPSQVRAVSPERVSPSIAPPPAVPQASAHARTKPTVQLRPAPERGSRLVAVCRAFTYGGLAALVAIVATQAFPHETDAATRALSGAVHHVVDMARGLGR